MLVQAGHVPQQRHAGGVQVDADVVDARFDDLGQRFLEVLRMNVVLVKPDADVLRVDLDQLAERVLQPPADGNGAAQGGVELRELFAAERAGRVIAGPGLVDDDVGQIGRRFGQARRATAAPRPAVGRPLAAPPAAGRRTARGASLGQREPFAGRGRSTAVPASSAAGCGFAAALR